MLLLLLLLFVVVLVLVLVVPLVIVVLMEKVMGVLEVIQRDRMAVIPRSRRF